MATAQTNLVSALTGPNQQFGPGQEQAGPGQLQTVTSAPMPLIPVGLPETRSPYLDLGSLPVANLPSVAVPAVVLNQYSGNDQTWQVLIEWDIPETVYGNLKEISLLSNNDAKTRYRMFLANINQNLPTDRPTSTPVSWPFPDNQIPGGTSVRIDCLSVDGTAIVVNGTLSGILGVLPNSPSATLVGPQPPPLIPSAS